MFERDLVTAYVVGFFAGIGFCVSLAGLVWLRLSRGEWWQGRPPTNEERDQKLIESMIEEEQYQSRHSF